MYNLELMTPEELKMLIKEAEQEIKDRATAQIEEKKTKVVVAIRELLAVCRSAGMWKLGSLYWECDDCGESNYFDILGNDILGDVANVLEGK